jgi:hypothetical protein
MATLFEQHKNFAISALTGTGTAIGQTVAGTADITAGTGSRFPSGSITCIIAQSGQVPDPTTAEIVTASVSGNTLNIFTRGLESSTARALTTGDIVFCGPTAGQLQKIETAINTLENSGPAGTSYSVIPFSVYGNLAIFVGDFKVYNDTPNNKTIYAVRSSVGIAPVGSAAIVDILNSGSTIFTSTKCNISSGSVTSGSVTGFNSLATVTPGQYLTMSVTQVGSTTTGADLLAQVTWS